MRFSNNWRSTYCVCLKCLGTIQQCLAARGTRSDWTYGIPTSNLLSDLKSRSNNYLGVLVHLFEDTPGLHHQQPCGSRQCRVPVESGARRSAPEVPGFRASVRIPAGLFAKVHLGAETCCFLPERKRKGLYYNHFSQRYECSDFSLCKLPLNNKKKHKKTPMCLPYVWRRTK